MWFFRLLHTHSRFTNLVRIIFNESCKLNGRHDCAVDLGSTLKTATTCHIRCAILFFSSSQIKWLYRKCSLSLPLRYISFIRRWNKKPKKLRTIFFSFAENMLTKQFDWKLWHLLTICIAVYVGLVHCMYLCAVRRLFISFRSDHWMNYDFLIFNAKIFRQCEEVLFIYDEKFWNVRCLITVSIKISIQDKKTKDRNVILFNNFKNNAYTHIIINIHETFRS